MAEPNDPLIGLVLKKTFTILEKIGAGGMGSVYRAEQKHLGRDVAVKVLAPILGGKKDIVQRFFREAKLLAALAHPHIVGIYDFGQRKDGLIYMVMEFLKGAELEDVIGDGLPLEVAGDLFTQICSGVGAAHAQGLIHRDLKPANIFLAEVSGQAQVVKVLDFGIAKAADGEQELTQAGFMMGTPGYISPEQIEDSASADSRCDIYALGAILYFMLTGQRCFEGKSAHAVMVKQISEEPDTSGISAKGLPAALEGVIKKAMSTSPDDRYATAYDLLAAFCEAADLPAPALSTGGTMQTASPRPGGSNSISPTLSQPDRGPQATVIDQSGPSGTMQGGVSTTMQPTLAGPNLTASGRAVVAQVVDGPEGPMTVYTMMGDEPKRSNVGLIVGAVLGLLAAIVGAAMIMSGDGGAEKAQAARKAASGVYDELGGRRQKFERAAKEAAAKLKEAEAAVANAGGDKGKLRQALRAAKRKASETVDVKQHLVDRDLLFAAGKKLLDEGDGLLAEQRYPEAIDAFEKSLAKFGELRDRIPEVEKAVSVKGSALLARWNWKDAADQLGVSSSDESRLADSNLASGDEQALNGIFSAAAGSYAKAESGYDAARRKVQEQLNELKKQAGTALAAAQAAQASCTAFFEENAGLTLPSRLIGDADLEAGKAQYDGGDMAAAMKSFAKAKAAYEQQQAEAKAELATMADQLEPKKAAISALRKQIAALSLDNMRFEGEPGRRDLEPPDKLTEARKVLTEGATAEAAGSLTEAGVAYDKAKRAFELAVMQIKADLAKLEAAIPPARKAWREAQLAAKKLRPNAPGDLGKTHDGIVRRVEVAESKGQLLRALLRAYEGGRSDLRGWMSSAWIEVGVEATDRSDHQAAADAYEQAVQYNPKDALAWGNLGSARYQLDKYGAAIEAFSKALAIDKRSRRALLGRGLALIGDEKYKDALADFSALTERNPRDFEALYYKANMESVMKDFVAARASIKAAIAALPRNMSAEQRKRYTDFAKALQGK